MIKPAPEAIVDAVLKRHGHTFAADAGARVDRNTPAPLFRLLCLSLLISARISSELAMSAARALVDAGWTTPSKLADSTWEQRTEVLNQSGYARYDESTARYLQRTNDRLIEHYNGDLRRLRGEADGDVDTLIDGLSQFSGIGKVGARRLHLCPPDRRTGSHPDGRRCRRRPWSDGRVMSDRLYGSVVANDALSVAGGGGG